MYLKNIYKKKDRQKCSWLNKQELEPPNVLDAINSKTEILKIYPI